MKEAHILIPASGASSRMRGRDKLVLDVDGEPLLRRQARAALATGAAVAVTLPPGNGDRGRCLDGLFPLTRLGIDDPAEGMAASIRDGARWALDGEASGMMILLADMPDIGTGDLALILARHAAEPDRVIRAVTAGGTPGHPVLFPRRLLASLTRVRGDTGGREVLAGEDVLCVPLPGDSAVTDLDTPEAWDAWRRATSRE